MSMIEKVSNRLTVLLVDQNTQTDPGISETEPRQTRPRTQRTSMLDGKSMLVQIKKSGIELSFK